MGTLQRLMRPLLHTEDLAIGHDRKVLLRDMTLDLRAGELVAMIGVNGIGKSTLLRTLAGLNAPLAGRVVADKDLATLSAKERAKRVSIVLTGRPQVGRLDVRSLIALGRQPWTNAWGTLSAEDQRAVDAVIERLNIRSLSGRAVMDLSDGECQQVMVARALAQSTPVLLLDEPTAFLDLPNRVRIVRLLRSIVRADGKTVLFSTHDIQLALDLCDRIVLLQYGAAPWQGTSTEAIASGVLATAFAGSGITFDGVNGTHRFVP